MYSFLLKRKTEVLLFFKLQKFVCSQALLFPKIPSDYQFFFKISFIYKYSKKTDIKLKKMALSL